MLHWPGQAQSVPTPQATGGRIYGTVTDIAGNVLPGAHVTLLPDSSHQPRTQLTDSSGFFNFVHLEAGSYHLTITSEGFNERSGLPITLKAGEFYQLPDTPLQIAPINTSVKVALSQHDLAEEQVHAEEKQRIFGVVPNFYTTYHWHAAPLSSGQKFQLAWRSSVDPFIFIGTGVIAGIEQWQNSFSGYGQGAQGYGKRYGAVYGDTFIGIMVGGAILPSILHQDPRYFYKGTGSIGSRALYAISTVVICRGDNGRWQPNYSNVLGNLAAAGISNLYYPASDRNGAATTIDNALIGTAFGAVGALVQEFLIKKISRGVPPSSIAQPTSQP